MAGEGKEFSRGGLDGADCIHHHRDEFRELVELPLDKCIAICYNAGTMREGIGTGGGEVTKIYYHVTGSEYQEGDPLLSLERLEEAGVEVEWKWEDADYGFDADVVCVFDDLKQAKLFKEDFHPNGKILKIAVVQEDLDDPIAWQTRWGFYITPRQTTVEEGYVAFRDGIPAEWIKGEAE